MLSSYAVVAHSSTRCWTKSGPSQLCWKCSQQNNATCWNIIQKAWCSLGSARVGRRCWVIRNNQTSRVAWLCNFKHQHFLISAFGNMTRPTGTVRWYSWYVLAPVDRGGATSTPRNSCSFGRKKIIKSGICSLRLGKYKNTCFPEILDYCGGITRKSCDPCKKQGPKHTSCTIVGLAILITLNRATNEDWRLAGRLLMCQEVFLSWV
jgi:hypothetical protein